MSASWLPVPSFYASAVNPDLFGLRFGAVVSRCGRENPLYVGSGRARKRAEAVGSNTIEVNFGRFGADLAQWGGSRQECLVLIALHVFHTPASVFTGMGA